MPTPSLHSLGFLKQEDSGSSQAKDLSLHCFQLSSNAVILQICLVILISTTGLVAGFQDAPSSSHTWSVSWLRGAKAENAKFQTYGGINLIARLPAVDPYVLEGVEDRKNWDCPQSRHCKCRDSTNDEFAYLFQLICLPSYPTSSTKAKNASPDQYSNSIESKGIAQSLSCSSEEADCANEGTHLPISLCESEEAPINRNQQIAMDVLPEGNSNNLTEGAAKESAAKIASQISTSNLSNIVVRQEPGGGRYNYASVLKGAKILASNKEAKGASNILNGDKDKYFHTPCSAPNKFVILELSEETSVATIAIANHEFYSSNLRVFELGGSLVYPTNDWTNLGSFEADNVRTLQTFQLGEPQAVRYLKFVIVSHYGSDFYCTLSVLEVHGVDAIERLLEDWIAEDRSTKGTLTGSSPQEERVRKNEPNPAFSNSAMPMEAMPGANLNLIQANATKDALTENLKWSSDTKGGSDLKEVSKVGTLQVAHHQASRPAPDAVLKLLLQKVRFLEQQTQPSLYQSIHELNENSKRAQEDYNRDLADITNRLSAKASELEDLKVRFRRMESRWTHEKLLLENNLRSQVTTWDRNMEAFRSHIKAMENKEMVALAISLLAIFAIIALQIMILCVPLLKKSNPKNRRVTSHGTCRKIVWFVPLLSCFLVVFVLAV